MLTLGCETRRDPAAYRWDGMRRADTRSQPKIVFQCTLAGWGVFEKGSRRWRVGDGEAFLTVLPSRHVYYLPEESAGWTFFWFNTGHPYVVERLSVVCERHGPVLPVSLDSRLVTRSFELFEKTCGQVYDDGFAEEEALLAWMVEVERHALDTAHPKSRRESMIEALRSYTLENLHRSFGIQELAAQHGLSRSHYSHFFQRATGLAPAACVLDVRLNEVRRRLRESGRPLKEIAAETGFADANHLCKAFRRLYQVSPGAYRKLSGA